MGDLYIARRDDDRAIREAPWSGGDGTGAQAEPVNGDERGPDHGVAGRDPADGEERFRRALESSLDAFAMCSSIRDADDRIVDFRVEYVNPAACDLSGRRREECEGRTVLELCPGLEGTELFRWSVEAADNGRATTREGTVLGDGAEGGDGLRFYDVRLAPFGDGFTASWRDATARVRAERASRDVESRYAELVRLAPAGIYEVDFRRRRFTSVNDAMCEMLGYSRDELLAMDPFDITDEEGRELFAARMAAWLAGMRPDPSAEYRVTARDGHTIDALLDVTFTLDEAGRPRGATVVAHDITERKRAERALLRDKELTEALNRINRALHSSLDMDEVIRRVVAEGAEALGSETAAITLRRGDGFIVEHVHGMPADMVGMHLDDSQERHAVLALQQRRPMAIADTLSDERVDREHLARYNIRSVLVAPLVLRDRPFGAIFFNYHAGAHSFTDSEVSFARQLAATASIALENARLFQEQERSEQELRAAKEELEEKVAERTAELARQAEQLRALASELTLAEQRERRRLAAVLHDDLQQLLAGAKFHLHGLRHTGDETVKGVGADVEGLLDEALEVCRTLTGELSPPILHQAGLVAALKWLVAWKQEKHGLRVDLEAAPDALPESEYLTVLLFQAARELLFNVVKHAGVDDARVRLRRSDDHLELVVADAGVGFDPDRAVDRQGRSGGFGLLSIKERLALLGGRLTIDSAPDHGSRITLVVPIAGAGSAVRGV